MPQRKDKDWLNGYKNKTAIYAVYKKERKKESEVAQSCLTLCDPMNCSMPGLPVHHQLLEFTQTHVHRVGDAIQPSHPLSSPYPPALNPSSIRVFLMSQLFTSGGQSIGTSVLASDSLMNAQD